MDITSFRAAIKSGSAIKNPASEAIASMTSTLNTVKAGVSGALATVTAIEPMATNLQAQAARVAKNVLDLQTKLPLAKAMDALSDRSKIMQGILPASTGGGAVKSLISGISGVSSRIASMTESLSGGLQAAAAGGQSAVTAAMGGLTGSMDQHLAEVEGAMTAATATMTESVANLKAYAFAKFCAMPQPAHIRALLDQVVPPASVPSMISVRLDEAMCHAVVQKRYTEAYAPSSPTRFSVEEPAAPAPVTNSSDTEAGLINGELFIDFKGRFTAYCEAQTSLQEAKLAAWKPLNEAAIKKRDAISVDYLKVKQAALAGDEAAKAQYAENLNYVTLSPEYIAARDAYVEWVDAKANVERLTQLWTTWALGGFKHVPPGPPW